jgi:hypothetical protein
MKRPPILPLGAAVAAVALTASPGIAAASPPDKRGDNGLVAFPLLALRSGGGHAVVNSHYSHYSHSSHSSHSSHYSHYSGSHNSHASHYSHSSHFSSSPGSPTPTPTPSATSSTAAPPPPAHPHHRHHVRKRHHHHAHGVASASASATASSSPAPTTSSAITRINTHTAANDSGVAEGLGALVLVIGGVTYILVRRRRRQR